jgi:hypothetical protein
LYRLDAHGIFIAFIFGGGGGGDERILNAKLGIVTPQIQMTKD